MVNVHRFIAMHVSHVKDRARKASFITDSKPLKCLYDIHYSNVQTQKYGKKYLHNSSNTSRRTSSNFLEHRESWRKSYLWVFERTSQTIPYFSRKSRWNKFSLVFVISSSDFQTSSTLLIFFVLGSWIINAFEKLVLKRSVNIFFQYFEEFAQ